MQSFILMQNIWKRDSIEGDETFGALFFKKKKKKKALFWPISDAATVF